MTTEDDFHRALDANPDDWQTRLVFADWLDERGDPRAAGYRALGAHRLRPNEWVQTRAASHWWWGGDPEFWRGHAKVVLLPLRWFLALSDRARDDIAWPLHDDPNARRDAEDAAARAFADLPATVRADLLQLPAGA